MAKFPEISHFFNLHYSSLGRHVKAASRKSLEIQAYSYTKLVTAATTTTTHSNRYKFDYKA